MKSNTSNISTANLVSFLDTKHKHALSIYVSAYDFNGQEYSQHGAPAQLVFEVNMDGGPHSNASSRLTMVGKFKNRGQANPLAARLEWESLG
jgi:hypothetical protein